MYSNNDKKTKQLLTIAKNFAHVGASMVKFNSPIHVEYMALVIDYTRDRALLRLKKAD